MISVEHATFTYPGAPSPILTNVSFEVPERSLLAILGPNGAGKTTLLRTMIGLQKWDSGRTLIDGTPMLDLPYVEDVRAQTDMNVVQTGDGRFIEVQGTAEHAPFDRDELNELLELATLGNAQLARAQKLALEAPLMERIEVRP